MPDNNLGFENIFSDDDPMDLSSFKPNAKRKNDAPSKEAIKQQALSSGFLDREGGKEMPAANPQPKTPRKKAKIANQNKDMPLRSEYYRTGRDKQFAKKARQEDIDRFNDLCKRHQWVGGQALEYAIDALQRMVEDPDSDFWKSRRFKGVD